MGIPHRNIPSQPDLGKQYIHRVPGGWQVRFTNPKTGERVTEAATAHLDIAKCLRDIRVRQHRLPVGPAVLEVV